MRSVCVSDEVCLCGSVSNVCRVQFICVPCVIVCVFKIWMRRTVYVPSQVCPVEEESGNKCRGGEGRIVLERVYCENVGSVSG